jgi:hypothetical protein
VLATVALAIWFYAPDKPRRELETAYDPAPMLARIKVLTARLLTPFRHDSGRRGQPLSSPTKDWF